MKKILFLFASVALLSSCLGDGDFGKTSPVAGGILLHNATIIQNNITLDPFNIAFRLNTLLIEGNGSVENVSTEMRQKLFPGLSSITATQASESTQYTLRFSATFSKTDWARSGVVVIKTNNISLSETGAIWDVTLDRGVAYALYVGQTANSSINVTPTSYTIYNWATNEWKIQAPTFKTEIPAASGSGETATVSEWQANYLIKQMSGDQSYAGISKAGTVYQVTIENAKGKPISLPLNDIIVSTLSPLIYSTNCTFSTISGDGELKMALSSDINAIATSKWLGESVSDCDPKIRITWDGQSEDL